MQISDRELDKVVNLGFFVTLLRRASLKAIDESLRAATKNIAPNTAGLLAAGVSALSGAVAGQLIGLLVQALSETDDALDRVFKNTEVLRQGGLRRAQLQLNDAMRIEPSGESEVSFRLQRLRASLESLDEAESVATQSEMAPVMFMKAIVTSNIPGAETTALRYCERFLELARLSQSIVNTETDTNEQQLHAHLAKLKTLPRARPARVGGLVGLGEGTDSMDHRVLEMKAAKRQRHSDNLRELRDQLEWSCLQVEALRASIVQVLHARTG